MGKKEQKIVVYDRMNNSAWYDYGQDKFGPTKKFNTQAEAKQYASKLAREKNTQVYDRTEGRAYTPRAPPRRRRARPAPWGLMWG